MPPDAAASALKPVIVRGRRPIDIGPLPGLAVTRDQIPANVQSGSKEQLRDSRALSIGEYMNSQMQGVTVNDYAGNPFQMDVNYRGFTASPQVGTPQGLSVFFDGVRVNEPFGDVVNWDLIPINAIDRFDLFPGSNPLFGLNTLGGAISVRSKSGFTAPGVEASVLAGSWGRKQALLSGGTHDGALAGFAALSLFDEDGWRDDSPSTVAQFYGRGDWALERATLTGSVLAADNRLIGNGLIPKELHDERARSVFTSPDRSKNRLLQFTLSGAYDLSETQNLTAHVYHRQSNRSGLNGDIYEGFDDFSANADFIEDPNAPGGRLARNGATQGDSERGNGLGSGVVDGTPIGLQTDTSLKQSSHGLALQANWNLPAHKFMVGASVDRSRATYEMTQRLGLIDASHEVVSAPDQIAGQYYAASHDIPGNDFDGTSTTSAFYASETWSARPNLHVTLSGRYNRTRTDTELFVRSSSAQVDLHELVTGTQGLDDNVNLQTRTQEAFKYTSFNPSVGLNWLPDPDLNLYGNVSRGARTPSVVELGCAFDNTPVDISVGTITGTAPRSLLGPGCNLPTTLSGDPFLPQIRSTSGEVGGRGRISADWAWDASVFRTDLKDDIYFIGVGDGKSFFDTVGKTRRQGFELGLTGKLGTIDLKADYSYTRATFESTFYTVSPHNSSADFDQNSQSLANFTGLGGLNTAPNVNATANGGRGTYLMTRVDPGARLPGIPLHALNLGGTWHASTTLKLALRMALRSSAYVRGNENNAHAPEGTDQQTGLYFCNAGAGQCQGGLQQQTVRPGRAFTNGGSVPGYAIFSLDADYKVHDRLSLFAHVSNLLDRKYFSAGRLGVNPFSAPTNGAIGPSGWNYNSAEWRNTTYVAPGSPRGVWVGLNYTLSEK